MFQLEDSDYKTSGLYDTPLYKRLRARGVALGDIGSRGGSKSYLAPFRAGCDYTGFDADAAAADMAAHKEAGWNRFALLPYCLWSREESVTLNITKSAVNCSLYPPAQDLAAQYNLAGFAVERTVQMQATTLDALVGRKAIQPLEVLKTDAQGADLAILKGAENTLRDSMEVVICEILFIPVYEGIPLFSEVESHMRARDFLFYGFIEQTFRSTRRLPKRSALQRERFFHADAVFFRRPDAQRKARAFDVQVLMALALHYYDYALELIDLAPYAADEKPALRATVEHLAHALAQRLGAMRPTDFLGIMRTADALKDFTTYADVK